MQFTEKKGSGGGGGGGGSLDASSAECKSASNSPFHVKQKYAWNARAFQLGYIFAMGNAPFPYISMGLSVNFRARAASRLTGCPNTTNINRKFNLSLTSCKLSRLLKMIVHEATVRQRHIYLTAKIVCSTTKQNEALSCKTLGAVA